MKNGWMRKLWMLRTLFTWSPRRKLRRYPWQLSHPWQVSSLQLFFTISYKITIFCHQINKKNYCKRSNTYFSLFSFGWKIVHVTVGHQTGLIACLKLDVTNLTHIFTPFVTRSASLIIPSALQKSDYKHQIYKLKCKISKKIIFSPSDSSSSSDPPSLGNTSGAPYHFLNFGLLVGFIPRHVWGQLVICI